MRDLEKDCRRFGLGLTIAGLLGFGAIFYFGVFYAPKAEGLVPAVCVPIATGVCKSRVKRPTS